MEDLDAIHAAILSGMPVEDMTDRELLKECVLRMRKTEELVSGFMESMSNNPMMRTMMGRFGQ